MRRREHRSLRNSWGQLRSVRQKVMGRLSKRSATSQYSLTKLHALSRSYSQQIGRSPNDICFKFIHGAISINNFPHHSNDLMAAIVIQDFIELSNKLIDINCVAIGSGRFFEQARGHMIIKPELRLQDSVEDFSPPLRHFTVDGSNTR